VAVVLLGLLFALGVLEVGLRVSGALFVWTQERRNQHAMEEGGEFVVLCIGESTTAMSYQGDPSYPEVLEEVLNERVGEHKFTVINRGIPAADSSVIIAQLERNLDKYKPRIVVAMMGANDQAGGAIPWDGVPVAERTRFPYSLRVYKLAALLVHQYVGGPAAKPDKPFSSEMKERPPMPGGLPGAPTGGPRGPGKRPTDRDLSTPLALSNVEAWQKVPEHPVVKKKDGAATRIDSEIFEFIERARRASSGGRKDEAEAILKEAIEFCPRCGDAYFRLAQLYELSRRGDEADAMYRKAIAAKPQAEFYYQLYARFLLIEERYEGAVEIASQAMTLAPDNEFAYITLGQVYEKLGRIDEAEAMFLKAHEMVPMVYGSTRGHRVFKSLAEFWDRHGRDRELEEAYLAALEQESEDEFLLGRLARFYEKRGRASEAAPYLERANRLRVERFNPLTRDNFKRVQEMLADRSITLVAVQYPGRPLQALERLFDSTDGVYFVDNEETFLRAVTESRYDALFVDHCYGDFGHATRRGNTLLANNVADTILQRVLEMAK